MQDSRREQNNSGIQARQIYDQSITKDSQIRSQGNQKQRENVLRQKSHQIAQSLEAPEKLNLSAPKNQTSKKAPRRRDSEPALQSSPPELWRVGGLHNVYLWSNGGGGEGGEEGRKREVSSINGLPFCSVLPGPSIGLLFLSFLVIHFAGAMILSRGFSFRVPGGVFLENDMAASILR